MHQVLQELESTITAADYIRSQVIDLMGTPDAIRQKGNNELLIHFWRGWHDYLYFACRGEKVEESGWCFAYD